MFLNFQNKLILLASDAEEPFEVWEERWECKKWISTLEKSFCSTIRHNYDIFEFRLSTEIGDCLEISFFLVNLEHLRGKIKQKKISLLHILVKIVTEKLREKNGLTISKIQNLCNW